MKSAPKNLAASVKTRLLHVAAQRGEDFNLLLLRYGIERLLYRLSRPEPLSDTFASDPAKQMPWAAFLRRNALSGVPPQFVEIVADLREFLGPVIASRAP